MRRPSLVTTAIWAAAAALVVSVGAALAAGIPGYTGKEGSAPSTFGNVRAKAGVSCKIGLQNPLAANESLQYMQKGAVAQAKALGCKIITLDDALERRQAGEQHAAAARPESRRDHLLSARSQGCEPGARTGEEAGGPGRGRGRRFRQPEGEGDPGCVGRGVAGARHPGVPPGSGARQGQARREGRA